MRSFRPLSMIAMLVATACSTSSEGPAPAPASDPGVTPAIELPSSVALPGPAFYPQSITSAADGTLFVGSIGTGEVVKFSAGSSEAQVIIAKSDPQVLIPGLIADDASSTLWVTTVKFDPGFANPRGELRSYDFGGRLKKVYPVPNQGSGIGEEPTIGPNGRIYVTDAFLGKVYVLNGPDANLEEWVTSDLLKPTDAQFPPFGAHGIAWDGADDLYVNNYNASRFVRVSIKAGVASEIAVTPALVHPEGIRMIDSKTFVATEHAGDPQNGRLTLISIEGEGRAASTMLRSGLKTPTNVTLAKGNFWITEGQTDQFLAGASGGTAAPKLPFLVQREMAP